MASDLRDFIQEVDGDRHLRVEQDFGGGFVRLNTSEAERRQAVHDIRCSEDIVIELLRNSRDAHARNIFMAVGKSGDSRSFVIIDDGDGIPVDMHDRIFEPRVTSKLDTAVMDKWGVHGRGMALYSIQVNAEQSGVVASELRMGASIKVITDTRKLTERKDQSTFPSYCLSDSGSVVVKGPRNIARVTTEFALEHYGSVTVYLGSPSEIAATLYEFGCDVLTAATRAFSNPMEKPVAHRLSLAATPFEFSELASGIGLDISERTARRILDGEIQPVCDLASIVSLELAKENKESNLAVDKTKRAAQQQSIHLDEEDAELLRQNVEQSFSQIAGKYYLSDSVNATVSARAGKLVISIPIVPDERS